MALKIKREVKIGLFATVVLAILYWGVNYLKGRDLFNNTNRYYATYEQISGIQPSSAIVIKGFKVGTISKISYDPTKSERIVLEFTIKSKYQIPVNSKAHIYSDGLLGGKGVEIEMGNSEFLLKNGDTLRSSMDKGLLEVAGSELEFFKQKANALVNEVMVTLENVNNLLVSNTENITATTGNLAAMSGSLKDVLEAENEDLHSIIKNLNSMTGKLNSTATKLDGFVSSAKGVADSINSADIPQLIRSLNNTAEQLNASIGKINNGDGTVGKLINDPEIYNSLAEASDNLNLLLEDVKKRPGRYVSFSVFGRKNQ